MGISYENKPVNTFFIKMRAVGSKMDYDHIRISEKHFFQSFQSRYVRQMWNTVKSVPGRSAIRSVKRREVPEYLLPGDSQIGSLTVEY